MFPSALIIRTPCYKSISEILFSMAGESNNYVVTNFFCKNFLHIYLFINLFIIYFFKFFHRHWDLMRICYYGFTCFCNSFLKSHPGYFVTPLCINGSAIETLFSQFKHGSGGTLMASSYSSVRAKLITKRTIHGTHVRDPYRDAPLYIRETDLPTNKPKKK